MIKIPYYFYLVFWIISLSINKAFATPKSNLQVLTAIIVLGIPFIILFVQILKNKNKIFNFYKKGRTKFKHIFYTLETLPILFLVIIALSIISLGGFKNFEERVKYEYFSKTQLAFCGQPLGVSYDGFGKYSQYFFKSNYQYLDYFKNHEEKDNKIIELAKRARDDINFDFNHCYFYGEVLKEAHRGNQIAKDILASMPVTEMNNSENFSRYAKSITSEKLSNPALKYNYAYTGKLERPERKKLFKESAEEGYLLGMQDYLWEFANENFNYKLHKDECPIILKYNNYLANQNSLIESINTVWALVGKYSYTSRAIFECSGKKTDFKKAILFMENFNSKTKNPKANSSFVTTYPALIYYNGWGNVDENKTLAINLFKKNLNAKSPNKISLAYLAWDSYKNNDKKMAGNYLKKIDEKLYLKWKSFKNIDIELEETSLKDLIKKYIDDWFKNPELVKTLNIYG